MGMGLVWCVIAIKRSSTRSWPFRLWCLFRRGSPQHLQFMQPRAQVIPHRSYPKCHGPLPGATTSFFLLLNCATCSKQRTLDSAPWEEHSTERLEMTVMLIRHFHATLRPLDHIYETLDFGPDTFLCRNFEDFATANIFLRSLPFINVRALNAGPDISASTVGPSVSNALHRQELDLP